MADPTVVDVLHRMKTLLRKGWTQGTEARTGSGNKVNYSSKSAASFCLHGAARRASVDLCGDRRFEGKAYRLLWKSCGNKGLVCFNDEPDRTKRQILAVVENALELVR